jgi:hypothetical protein
VFVLRDVEDHRGIRDDELLVGDVAQHHALKVLDPGVGEDALGYEVVVCVEEVGFNQFLLLLFFVEVVLPLDLVFVSVGFDVVFDGVFQEVVASVPHKAG